MRISDWSSDVCSSDLRAKLLWEPADNVKFTLGGQYSRRRDESLFAYSALNGNTLGPKTAVEPYDVAVNIAPLTETESWNVSLQIGSASCRERVCQYG